MNIKYRSVFWSYASCRTSLKLKLGYLESYGYADFDDMHLIVNLVISLKQILMDDGDYIFHVQEGLFLFLDRYLEGDSLNCGLD